jgi:hypothetical protein
VRQRGVPFWYSSAVFASGLKPSILAVSRLNSDSVMSLVQHFAEAFLPVAGSAGLNACEHFAARSGTARILVVVCKSHCECRHTSSRSLVKVTSHSITPAPMRAAAR